MFSSEAWLANPSSGFYNGATSTSMRFRRGVGSNTEINRDPSSAGDRKKHTLAFWVKRCKPSDGSQIVLCAFASSYSDFAYFRSDDRFEYSVGNAYSVATDMKFRDVSAWYHIVAHLDVANSTTTSRLRFWVNGVEQSKTVTYGSYPADQDYAFSNTVDQTVGGATHFGGYELDGYLCDLNFIDGSLVPYTSFGEFKNGIWIPIDIDTSAITYGTNGFRMLFNGTDTDGPSTSGSVNANSVGASSVNSNHFHAYSTALANHSALPDNPENNFCTWNALFKGGERSSSIYANSTLSNGNLEVSVPTNSYMGNNFRPTSGKWYCEIRVKTIGSTNGEIDWGWLQATTYSSNIAQGNVANKWGAIFYGYAVLNGGIPYIAINDETTQLGGAINVTMQAGDILQLALDIDNNKGFIGRNNAWLYTNNLSGGNPATGANPTHTFTDDEAQNLQWYIANGTSTDVHVANFGQDSTFGGAISAGGNADANGIGDFAYAPPSGFLALCTANLEEPTIGPNSDTTSTDHFNTITYSGNDDATRTFNVGFPPDLSWFKAHASGYGHQLYDSSRGVHKYLQSNVAGTEQTSTEGVTSFDTSGNLVIGTNAFLNEAGTNGTIWNWKANNGTKTTNDASATSIGTIDSEYQANTTAGFSIVQFEATGTAGTIAHGLSQAPTFMIVKSRDQDGTTWQVYYGDNTDYLRLNSNGATIDGASTWNDTSPTSTVFSVGDNGGDSNNSSGGSMIGYMFHDVEGYSKIGTYNPNNSTDSAFVYTGFKPAMVILKGAEINNQEWCILDNKNPGYNPVYNFNPDSSAGQTTSNNVDFVSNGFKIRATGGVGYLTSDYIYIAFAEAPFKYANGG